MNKYHSSIIILLSGLLLFSSSCQEEYELGTLVNPTQVELTYTIVGADEEHPEGDGSGMVNFSTTADHAITYYYSFGDGKDDGIAPSGNLTHVFSIAGVNTYNVTVFAVGTGGITSSKTVQVEVLSTFTDDEAVQFLSGGSSKTWYWAADQLGHLGLGPNDQTYPNGGHTYADWYNAAAWEKSATSLYQTQCIFTLADGKLTFEQVNPTGQAFIQGLYAQELGLGEEGSYDFEIDGVKNVAFGPSSSIATIDGGYRGTTMSYSEGGFMGFYAGSSTYEIIEVTDNILRVRMVQANEPLFAWYHIFTPVKPEQ